MPKRLTTHDFIIKSKKVHGDKYDYSLVDYKTTHDKVKIICPIHGEFEQTPKQHLKGRGCVSCGKVKCSISKRLTTHDFIIKSKKVHGDKYDYSLVDYKRSSYKVKIICPIHGVFEQTPSHHFSGQGCSVCRYIKSGKSQRLTNTDVVNQFKKVHGDKYDYSLVDYKTTHDKVKIICPIHGEFEQIPLNHKRHQGCPKCKTDNMKIDVYQFIQNAKKVHGDKYDYSLVDYIDSKTKVKIICPVHGEFEQKPANHINCKNNCPVCMTKISNQELELQEWLRQFIDIKVNNRFIIPPYELDIVIHDKKIAIEYNGLYWHSEQQGKDKHYHLNKYNLCKQQGYRLIQIWENEWLHKKDIVKSIILNAIGIHKEKIHGRKCIIKNVSPKEARPFYDDNHIQGFKGGHHKGLYYQNDLVSLMSINSIGILERFVNKNNILVHGAFSKLLKSFNIDNLITFADLRYFTGDVYRNNGFEYVYTSKPNYFYFKNNYSVLYSRIQFQKHKLKDKLNKFNPNKTEYQNMFDNGYDRIWDCGNLKFKYKGN